MKKARIVSAFVLLGGLLLGGCATPAARELTVAARNYEARSLEALSAVDTMARREIEAPSRPEREAEDDFVARMRVLQPTDVTETRIEQDLRPFGTPAAQAASERAATLDEMRNQHAEFSAIFLNVERAGLLGRRTVSQRVPPVLDTLIAQQVSLARMLARAPPRLVATRSALAAEIALVLRDAPEAAKDAALRDLRRRWLEMEAQEQQLLADTSTPLLTAAATGLALREQVQQYGKLSLADLQAITQEMLGFVGAATGRDVTALSGQVETLAARINADPDFSAAARELLNRAPVPALPTGGE